MRPALIGLLMLAGVPGCGPTPPEAPPPPPPEAPPPPPPVPFTVVPIESSEGFLQWATELGAERMSIVLKLNRLDQQHVRIGDSLLVPTVFLPELEHAPFPARMPLLDSVPFLLAVSRQIQAFGGYQFGTLIRWGPTSTGRAETPTPAGLFFTNWKSRETVSTEEGAWVLKWYFNFLSARGISFHEFDLPGYPASHACVRLLAHDAEWLYGWAEQWRVSVDGQTILAYGTPVLVFGEYDFEALRPPWRVLTADGSQPRITAEQLASELAPHLAVIKERVADRLRVVGPPGKP